MRVGIEDIIPTICDPIACGLSIHNTHDRKLNLNHRHFI